MGGERKCVFFKSLILYPSNGARRGCLDLHWKELLKKKSPPNKSAIMKTTYISAGRKKANKPFIFLGEPESLPRILGI